MASHSSSAGAPAPAAHPNRKRVAIAGGVLVVLLLALAVVLLVADDKPLDAGGETIKRQTDAGPPATPATSNGTLTAGGKQLLESEGGAIGRLAGDKVTGRRITVQSTAQGGGFWVGTAPSERVFVAGPSSTSTQIGQRVDVSGTVARVAQGDAKRFGLDTTDQNQLESQGGYVKADEVTPSQGS